MTEEELIERYPEILGKLGWGIECGPGWYKLIDSLCNQLRLYTESGHPQVVATQVKEKYGTLRFYTSGADSLQWLVIEAAENLSAETCEDCGDTSTARLRRGGWLRCLCDECDKGVA